jgi:RNA polymerase sigma-70 factor, ECF subfamily
VTSGLANSNSAQGATDARFEREYEAHFSYVWRSLRRMGVRHCDLGDLTHDVFVVAWKQRAVLDADRSLRPWLFGVAFRVASSHRRRSWFRRECVEPELEFEDPNLGPEQQTVLKAELRQLQQALCRVPLRHRAVLLLHDFDEIPMTEAAQALGLPLKTAYSRLAAGRKRFRQVLRQAELEPFDLTIQHTAAGEHP